MMKQEFEQRVGKEVDWEVFEMYEAMYMATNLTKDEFCALLDKKAIPESKASQEAKKRNEETIAEVRKEIDAIDAQIVDAQDWVGYYQWCISVDAKYGDDTNVKCYKRSIRDYRAQIETLKKKKQAIKRLFCIR